jgi:nicotinamide-nucleotide amidase
VLDELVSRVSERLGDSVFSSREENLAEVLGRKLKARSMTLATAESCTGGLIGKLLTDTPGSSEYFRGGVVCYSDELKARLLGVDERLLREFGAVSEPVAREMALGARDRLGSSVGLSVTGIAGPSGGSQEKPVGTVYLGLAISEEAEVKKLSLPGSREAVRLRTAHLALDWVRRKVV